MTQAALEDLARDHHLALFGALALTPKDKLGDGTLFLLGPHEPGFWHHVTAQSEFKDKAPNPLDRWSKRVIDAMAAALGGTAAYPFGAPLRPFMTWALRSGRAWSSPVGILVHNQAGLMVSYRGAIALPVETQNTEDLRPCDRCTDQPCRTACPASALTPAGYDVPACHTFLDTPPGTEICLAKGCAVRRSCPAGAGYGRIEAQSAYHMRLFHK